MIYIVNKITSKVVIIQPFEVYIKKYQFEHFLNTVQSFNLPTVLLMSLVMKFRESVKHFKTFKTFILENRK